MVARWDATPDGTISGRALVLDGDTLAIGDERLRLRGIDAPELEQLCRRDGEDYACGREARAELRVLIGGSGVACDVFGHDKYGRLLVECVAEERPINGEMVERGWAIAYGGYGEEEHRARQAHRGLWAGEFDLPQDWRRQHGHDAERHHGGVWGWLRSLFGD